MGLDMYLYKKTYIGNKWKKPEDQIKIEVEGVKQERVSEIEEEIGYWRKANAIHQWFINNCNNGDDECHDIYVDEEKLQELLDVVNKVLASSELIEDKVCEGYEYKDGKKVPIEVDGKKIKNPEVAMKLLPTTEGFFFGGTDYDEYYYQQLVDTKKILEEALKSKNGDFYYHPSW